MERRESSPREARAGGAVSGPRRPALCYSAARGWLNDPNGLVFFDGEYHLFFQYHPHGAMWGPMHWGHAVSEDLVAWRDLGIALEPDEKGVIFSGSAVVDEGDASRFFGGGAGLVVFYTANRRVEGKESSVQEQCLAFSHDRGRTWTKYEGNPIIPNPGIVDFRDPKVFRHEQTGRWIMVVSGGDRALFYGSADLLDWRPLSEFTSEGYGPRSAVWECPDILRFPCAMAGGRGGDLWLLKVSVTEGNPAGGSGEIVIPGRFDGIRFEALETGGFEWLDVGQDCYASQSWHIPGSDRIVITSWMSNHSYAGEVPAGDDWRGILSLPRELCVEPRGEAFAIIQRTVREVARYALESRTIIDGELPARVDAPLPAGPAEIRLETRGSADFAMEFSSEDGDLLIVRCGGATEGREMVLDRSAVGTPFSCRATAVQRIALPDAGLRELVIFYDGCVWQMFVNGGEIVSSNLVFPTSALSRVSLERLEPLEPLEPLVPPGSAGDVRLTVTAYARRPEARSSPGK
ncbi:MAG: glycoside hydrolase family 32 protein [Spirochaetaceae bacterium]|nr:glycoside hydrolase family 32 protein [Spirochaetaceae bacterium]